MHSHARIRSWASVAVCLSASVLGCGSSGADSVTGTLDGQAFTVADAISGVDQDGSPILLFTSFAPACAAVETLHLGKNGKVLEFSLGKTAAPGSYSVPAQVAADYLGFDAACSPTLLSSSAGVVTITAAHDGVFSGTLDLTMSGSPKGEAGHLRGSFTTTPCAAIGSAMFHDGDFTCP